MQFTDMGDERVRVTLEAEDLTDYKLLYHDFEKNSPKCKRLVLQLMGKAKQALGVEYTAASPCVEVFPAKDGGCILYFSAKGGEKTGRKQEIWLLSNSVQLLCQASKALIAVGYAQKEAALWQREEGQFLLTLKFSKEELIRLQCLLSEFGSLTEPTTRSHLFLQEHGKPLMEKNVLLALSELA